MKASNPYNNPFIIERADPYVVKGENCYYFTASYPAVNDAEHGYDRIILRKSETVSGLAAAEEKAVWKAHEEGNMARHIWAPEIHCIKGRWYIFFAAGDKDNVWNIRPYVLMCEGDDPMNDKWIEKGRMQASAEDTVSFTHFSLDMTYFEHKGKHYLIWAESIGDSSLFISEINPDEPWRLIRKPILLTKPEYDWEKIRHRVNEGAAVLKTENKVFVFFSASGTGEEYCMGMLYMDAESDPMEEESWIKLTAPVLQTADLEGEAGPGHNSFTTDEEGRLLIVYHARPASHFEEKCGTFCSEPLYDPCRHARIRLVSFDAEGMPLIEKDR